MTLRSLRSFVERRSPLGAALYRSLRDHVAAARLTPRRTVEGFLLAADEAMLNGAFEPDERRIAQRLLPLCDVFVDVGANVGLYTCLARAAGRKVVAVEPQPLNVQQIFRSLEANGWDDVEVWPVGVAAAAGALRLYGGGTGASLVRGWAGISDVFRQTIPVTTLDTLLGGRFEGARLFVKMDIEGAERDVLAQNTEWASHVGCIKVEVHGDYTPDDCVRDLERLGFRARRDRRHEAAVLAER